MSSKSELPKHALRHSIFGELMLFVIVILVPIGLMLGAYVLNQVNQTIEQQYLQSLTSLANEKSASINEYIDDNIKSAEALSHTQMSREAMVGFAQAFHDEGANATAYQKLNEAYGEYFSQFLEDENYYDLLLIDVDGNIVYTTKHEADFATNLETGSFNDTGLVQVFRQSLDNLQASNSSFAYYDSSKEPAAFIASPITYHGEVMGVLALQFDTQRFYKVINNYSGLGETGEVVVGQKVGDHILITAPMRHDADAAFQRTIALDEHHARPIREASQGRTGAGKVIDWRGKEVLAVWQYIPALQWGMVVKIDTQEAFAYWQGLRKSLVVYTLLTFLLLCLLLFVVTRRITRPLRRLAQASVDVGLGRQVVSLPKLAHEHNEVSILSAAFKKMFEQVQSAKVEMQRMLEALAENNRLLDQRVNEQTSRVRAVLEFTADGMITIDADGMIERANPAACEIFSYTKDELRGLSFTALMPEKERAAYTQMLKQDKKVKGGFNIHRELDGLKQSGALFPMELRMNDMQVGEQSLCLATIRDITERTALEHQQVRLMEAMNQMQDAVLITDANAVIEYVNPAYEELSGFSADELMGKTPAIVSSGKMPQAFYKKMWGQLRSGQLWRAEFINKHKNGEFYEVDQSISPIFDANENIVGFTSVQRDITAEKEERSKLEHIQRLESLGVLAGGIAHDFNNLLTAIMGNAALAKMKLDHLSPAVPLLSNIEQASDRAAALCKQMLAYSGKGKFIVEPVNLTHMVREMMNLLEVSIDKNVVMRLDLSEQLLPIDADVAQMQQVIMNLVINASEAIDKHSGTLTIYTGVVEIDDAYIRTTYLDSDLKAGRFVSLEVSDTGCGMDTETQRRLFEPFFTTKFTGRGLGMSAILGIIRGHHGGIKV
ncbi:MAG: PAS domain S-box protein, partial [Mariprofundaceae bacterium]|nr:PAS domain S-box protein [Mariprofundaceae bacterium]